MSIPEFTIKRNDRRPTLRATLLTTDGTPEDLSQGSPTVTFSMKPANSETVKVNAQSATIVDDVNGLVEYAWASGDTDTAGRFIGEFSVDQGGLVATYPNDGNIAIRIVEDIG